MDIFSLMETDRRQLENWRKLEKIYIRELPQKYGYQIKNAFYPVIKLGEKITKSMTADGCEDFYNYMVRKAKKTEIEAEDIKSHIEDTYKIFLKNLKTIFKKAEREQPHNLTIKGALNGIASNEKYYLH